MATSERGLDAGLPFGQKRPGRTREKLAELLVDAGVMVAAGSLYVDPERYSRFNDCRAWFATEATYKGKRAHVGSNDTMTDIVRSGGVVLEFEDWGTVVEIGVHAAALTEGERDG